MEGSARADRVAGLCVKQAVQSILVDLGNAEKLHTELTMFAPTNRCGLDGDGRSEVSRANEDSDSGTGPNAGHARHCASACRQVKHRAFANRIVACRGEIDLQVDRDSRVLATFNHLDSLTGARFTDLVE